MGRSTGDFQDGVGPRITDEKLHEEPDSGAHVRQLSLYTHGSDYPKATLEYATEPGSRDANIDYLKSHEENKGHATTLLHHLYRSHPGNISWGTIVHPASKRLFKKFDEQYGRSNYGSEDYS